MNRKFGSFFAVALTAGLLLAGCGGGDDDDGAVSENPAGQTAEAPAGNEGQNPPAAGDQAGGGQVDAPVEEPTPVDTTNIGVIENPDDPASSRQAAISVSRVSTDAFTDRNPTTFCELIDPEFIERQFENGIEDCEEQMGKVLAPNSVIPDLESGRMIIKGNTASMNMRTADGEPAGVATFVRRDDRWYLSMDAAPGNQ